jgi:DNA-binding Lrp family transcriptional regulator
MARIDELDISILEHLMRDSTQNYRFIARTAETTPATVHNRIRKLKESNVIDRFTIRVDPKALGYDLCVIVDLQVMGGYLERVQKRYAKNPNICAIYDITGEHDTTFIAKFRTMEELNRFIKTIASDKYVVHTSTKVVLNVLKEESVPTLRSEKRSEQAKVL